MRHALAILAPALLGAAAASGAEAETRMFGGGPGAGGARSLHTRALNTVSLALYIDDASPLFHFEPSVWAPAWSSAARREVHTSIRTRSTVELAVEGTGVVLYGARDPPSTQHATASAHISSDSAVSVRDGKGRPLPSTERADGVLVEVRNSSFDSVEATFESTSEARYSVSGATIFTHLLSDKRSIDSVSITQVPFVDGERGNEALGWLGEWRLATARHDGNGGSTEMVGTRGAAVHLPVPDGSSFIVVCGSVGPNRGEMVVEWEPPIRDGGERINTSSWRSVPTTTLYVRRLDPYLAHNLSLQMDGTVGLESVSFYNAWAVPAMSVLIDVQPGQNSTQPTETPGALSNHDFDHAAATDVARILGGAVGGVGLLTLVAVLRTCWIRRRRKEKRDEERRASYAAYMASAPPSYRQHWAGGDGVPSTSEPPSIGKSGGLGLGGPVSTTTSRASTSATHAPVPSSPTISITPAPPRRTSSPPPPQPSGQAILLSTLYPLTPTASPGDAGAARLASPPRRVEAGPSGFPGRLDLPQPPHDRRRVSFTSDERPRPTRAALERLQERLSEDSGMGMPAVGPGARRGSLSRLLEAGEPLSRRITHVGEPLARRISRATDQSEQDVWDDIGIAPPTSTAAVLEGRRASRSSSTDARGRVSPDIRGRGSLDSQRS